MSISGSGTCVRSQTVHGTSEAHPSPLYEGQCDIKFTAGGLTCAVNVVRASTAPYNEGDTVAVVIDTSAPPTGTYNASGVVTGKGGVGTDSRQCYGLRDVSGDFTSWAFTVSGSAYALGTTVYLALT